MKTNSIAPTPETNHAASHNNNKETVKGRAADRTRRAHNKLPATLKTRWWMWSVIDHVL